MLPFTYLKIAGVIAIAAGAGYVAWSLRGIQATEEKEQAVHAAVKDIKAQLEIESQIRTHYATLADQKLDKLLKSISTINATQQIISAGIAAERKRDPAFYNQPLPAGGLEEWKRARSLAVSSPASPASAAVQPIQ